MSNKMFLWLGASSGIVVIFSGGELRFAMTDTLGSLDSYSKFFFHLFAIAATLSTISMWSRRIVQVQYSMVQVVGLWRALACNFSPGLRAFDQNERRFQ
jgi:hypothetical protein